MSLVVAAPETLTAAAADLADIGSTINAASTAAATRTAGVLAAGADEVSAQIAVLFGAHAQEYQVLSGQVAAFNAQFVQAMAAGAGSYASAEAANASPLQSVEQDLLAAVN